MLLSFRQQVDQTVRLLVLQSGQGRKQLQYFIEGLCLELDCQPLGGERIISEGELDAVPAFQLIENFVQGHVVKRYFVLHPSQLALEIGRTGCAGHAVMLQRTHLPLDDFDPVPRFWIGPECDLAFYDCDGNAFFRLPGSDVEFCSQDFDDRLIGVDEKGLIRTVCHLEIGFSSE